MDKYFEGNYRRMPEQNLAGARKRYDVSELINKVQVERKKREEARMILEKTILIQSTYRGYSCRKQMKQKFVLEFEDKMTFITENSDAITLKDLYYLLKRLIYFFPQLYKGSNKTPQISKIQEDLEKFILVMKFLQSLREPVIENMKTDRLWLCRICFFLGLNVRLIENLPDGAEDNVPCLLRTILLFSEVSSFTNIVHDKEPLKFLVRIWEALLNNDVINILLITVNMKPRYTKGAFDEVLKIQNKIFQNLIQLITTTDNYRFREYALKVIGITLIKPPLSYEVCSQVLDKFKEMDGFPLTELCKVFLTVRDVDRTPESLFRFLHLDNNQNAISPDDQCMYFKLLSQLLFHLIHIRRSDDRSGDDSDDELSLVNKTQSMMLHDSVQLLNSTFRTRVWIEHLNNILLTNNADDLMIFCKCLYFLWLPEQLPLYSYRILKNVAFHSGFLKALWQCITSLERAVHQETTPQTFYTWKMLAHGVHISSYEADTIIPLLTMFCFFLKHLLAILNDDVFYRNEHQDHVPFRLSKIIEIATILKDVAVGVISLAYPTFSFTDDDRIVCTAPTKNVKFNLLAWKTLLEQIIGLLRIIHIRDSRRGFTKKGFWLTNFVPELPKPSNQIRALEELTPFSSKSGAHRSFNVYEDRFLATLRYLPFVIDFYKRLTLYQHLIHEIKTEFQNPGLHILQSDLTSIQIRRNYIYEDAFEKLNIEEVDDVRIQIKINLVNALGVDEVGIDGGGLFREFIIELMKTAFDPNRGFFLMNRDNELFPNPKIDIIEEDYSKHYFFIGRMLGKALFENILVEIPLAEFFLAKLLGNKYDSYMNGLASLDPDMYRNLMYLMNYNGDFADLGLDFTLSEDDFGRRTVVNLKPNGANIQVTKDNAFEYIHLVARYKIHTQISVQTQAFLDGLTSVIPQPWLAMFSTKELQLIISGNESPIDIKDLRDSTVYTGDYSNNHPTIEMFWRIVSNFDNSKKSLLIKFVTSCSRPPLLGFKNLQPPFCIQYVESDEMLPTTSTCMNTLKLPNIQDERTLRKKLIYAISSGSGFDLP